MKAVFADTFYWVALVNRRDKLHREVLEFSRTLGPTFVLTTDEVLTELLAYFAGDAHLRREAALVVRDVLTNPDTRVIPQSRTSFLAGFSLYEARPDKGYSLTDCISMATMRRENLTDVLTNDRHFEQEGFRALFRGEVRSG